MNVPSLGLIIELQKASKMIYKKVNGWLEVFIDMTPNIILAILIVIFFVILGRLIRAFIHKINPRISVDSGVVALLANIVFFSVVTTGIFVALSILHLDKMVTSLLAGAGIIGLALGFAFQETTANFLSGIFMTFRKPISIGDIVETNGLIGKVREVNLRATVIETPQGQNVIIPNKSVFYTPIINYSTHGMRRIDLEVGVSYGENLEKVKSIVLSAVANIDGLLPERKPEFYYTNFADSSINFSIRLWTGDVGELNNARLRSEAILSIKAAFDAEGITIPFPIRTLDFGIKGGTRLDEVLDRPENATG